MRFEKDYDKALERAQKEANDTGLLLRLRVSKALEKGYTWGFVPAKERQFGRDLDGELIYPTK